MTKSELIERLATQQSHIPAKTVEDAVKEMLDNAMARSQGGLLKFNKKKRVDRDGYTVLYEKDFAK